MNIENSTTVNLNGRLHGHLLLLSPVLFRMLRADRAKAPLVLSQLPVGSIRVDWHRVGITLMSDSLRPSLILFPCRWLIAPFHASHFNEGYLVVFSGVSFWEGIIHFWWRALIRTWKLGWKMKLDCYRAITSLVLGLQTCRIGRMCVKGHITVMCSNKNAIWWWLEFCSAIFVSSLWGK